MFNEYGFTYYHRCFGNGRLESMIHYLDRMHKKYPDALIVTNFKYAHATNVISDWQEILNICNGENGVIIAVDGIHGLLCESECFKRILSEILQCRLRHTKLVATSPAHFLKLPKFLRCVCLSVVFCERFFGRFILNTEYDAFDYERYVLCIHPKDLMPLSLRFFLSHPAR